MLCWARGSCCRLPHQDSHAACEIRFLANVALMIDTQPKIAVRNSARELCVPFSIFCGTCDNATPQSASRAVSLPGSVCSQHRSTALPVPSPSCVRHRYADDASHAGAGGMLDNASIGIDPRVPLSGTHEQIDRCVSTVHVAVI